MIYESPRHKQSNEKKELIIKTALALFKKYGYDNTTIQDICRNTGIASGSIYNFFENKDGILKAIAYTLLPPDRDFFAITPESVKDPFKAINEYACFCIDIINDLGADLTRAMHMRQEFISQNPDGSVFYPSHVKKMAALIDTAQQAGSFVNDIHPVTAAVLIDVNVHSTAFLWIYNRERISIEECFQICFNRFIAVFKS